MSTRRPFRPELLAPLLRDLAAKDTAGEIPVRGISMCPTLLDGDRARVTPARIEDLRVGDIVVRIEQAGPIIHRLVGWWPAGGGREGWRILTKGDGSRWFDPPIPVEGVVARVIAIVRDDQVRRLDRPGMRIRGAGRAAASLLRGLLAEAWDRRRRAARLRVGRPGG